MVGRKCHAGLLRICRDKVVSFARFLEGLTECLNATRESATDRSSWRKTVNIMQKKYGESEHDGWCEMGVHSL